MDVKLNDANSKISMKMQIIYVEVNTIE